MIFFSDFLRRGLLGAVAGVSAGVAATVFLCLLQWATDTRETSPELIWALPLAGWLVGWAYHHYGGTAARGNNLILDEIHNPKAVLPKRMAPFVLLGTVITHLFGGSAGREGTAVQMGATLADQIAKVFRVSSQERTALLMAGAGGGFAAAIGAPLAGAVFGMEVIQVGRLRRVALWECLVASLVAFETSHRLGAPHSQYGTVPIPAYAFAPLCWALLAGIVFGLAARLFVIATHVVESLQKRFVAYPPVRPLLGGILLVALFRAEGSLRYAGLGIGVIQESLVTTTPFSWPAWKLVLTAITIGSGYKGGEFIPLVFIGSTLGSSLSSIIPAPTGFLAALGFAAVFGAGANTPLACALMAAEVFGPSILPYALLACLAGFYVSGHPGIYQAQPIGNGKADHFRNLVGWRKSRFG